MKYIFTQHTLGHIALPELDDKGKPVMVPPDPEAVQAAIAANEKHTATVKAAVKNEAMQRTKDVARKVSVGQAAADQVRVAPKVPVPVAQVKIQRDVLMYFGGEYELPEANEDVQHYVLLGYLTPLVEVKVTADPPAKVTTTADKSTTGKESEVK